MRDRKDERVKETKNKKKKKEEESAIGSMKDQSRGSSWPDMEGHTCNNTPSGYHEPTVGLNRTSVEMSLVVLASSRVIWCKRGRVNNPAALLLVKRVEVKFSELGYRSRYLCVLIKGERRATRLLIESYQHRLELQNYHFSHLLLRIRCTTTAAALKTKGTKTTLKLH